MQSFDPDTPLPWIEFEAIDAEETLTQWVWESEEEKRREESVVETVLNE